MAPCPEAPSVQNSKAGDHLFQWQEKWEITQPPSPPPRGWGTGFSLVLSVGHMIYTHCSIVPILITPFQQRPDIVATTHTQDLLLKWETWSLYMSVMWTSDVHTCRELGCSHNNKHYYEDITYAKQ